MDNMNFDKVYNEMFSNNEHFKDVYLNKRGKLYSKILEIAGSLGVSSMLDIGCAYGLLVEEANRKGLDCWGMDLQIDELKRIHKTLPLSSDKFIYGTIEDRGVVSLIGQKGFDAVLLLDTLRSLGDPGGLACLTPRYIIIKDACDNARIRKRPQETILRVKLYSPASLLETFPGYHIRTIYPSRFLFRINSPSAVTCALINSVFPTYCVVLEKNKP